MSRPTPTRSSPTGLPDSCERTWANARPIDSATSPSMSRPAMPRMSYALKIAGETVAMAAHPTRRCRAKARTAPAPEPFGKIRAMEPGELTVVILCGGRGTRLQERTQSIPKPLVEIGGRPIVWHVIQIYLAQGFHRFLLCTGYKGELVARFADAERWPEGV